MVLTVSPDRPCLAAGGDPQRSSIEISTPQALLSFYNYPDRPADFTLRRMETRERYLVYEVRWRSWVRSGCPVNDQVVAYYYQPSSRGKVPAIVMLHSYGTRRAGPERRLCAYLAERGIACFLPFLPYHGPRTPTGYLSGRLMLSSDLRRTLRAVQQAVIDVRTAADWLQQRPEVNRDHLGVVGISLGGILVNLVMGVDSRLATGVSVLGGAQVADLMWKSPVLQGMHGRLEERNFTLAQLREWARPIEPLTFAQFNRPRRVLMVNGRYDIVVPPWATTAAWHAFGEPPIIWVDTGHYGLFLTSSAVANVVSAYLLDQFGECPGPLPSLRAYTVKLEVLADEDLEISAGVNLTLSQPWREGSLDLALTSQGAFVAASHMLAPGFELGLRAKLGDGDLRVRPYLGAALVL